MADTNCIVVAAHTPDVDIEELDVFVKEIERDGVVVAPLTTPLEYSMIGYNWNDGVYDPNTLIKFFSRNIGMEDGVSLIVFVGENRFTGRNAFCIPEKRSCLVSKNASREDLLTAIRSVCSR